MNAQRFGLDFHHLGMAVRDPMPAFAFLAGMGYQHNDSIFDPLQGVNLSLCLHAFMPDMELIWPGTTASPIDRILEHSDAAIYHLCYTSADPLASLAAIEREGLDIIEVSPPTPARLFSGNKVSFHCIAGFGLIEILECSPASAHPAVLAA